MGMLGVGVPSQAWGLRDLQRVEPLPLTLSQVALVSQPRRPGRPWGRQGTGAPSGPGLKRGLAGTPEPLGSAQGLGVGTRGGKPRKRSKGWRVSAPAWTLPFGAGVPSGARPRTPGLGQAALRAPAIPGSWVVSRSQPQRAAPPPRLGTSELCAPQGCHLLLPEEGTTSPGLAPLLPGLEGPHIRSPPKSSLPWGHRKYTQGFRLGVCMDRPCAGGWEKAGTARCLWPWESARPPAPAAA